MTGVVTIESSSIVWNVVNRPYDQQVHVCLLR